LVDDYGTLLVKRRVGDDPAGFRLLLELLTKHAAISFCHCGDVLS
jgi:hypothetical protein